MNSFKNVPGHSSYSTIVALVEDRERFWYSRPGSSDIDADTPRTSISIKGVPRLVLSLVVSKEHAESIAADEKINSISIYTG